MVSFVVSFVVSWRMTFCMLATGLCHALTGLKICFWAVLGALPRAGMFSPFRAGSLAFLICRKMGENRQNIGICQISRPFRAGGGREIVELAGGGGYGFATTEWT